ncbi:YjcZ family sporulation protein [Paenibacillus sp. N1-5-1-14]|nr:YjcZ family sporulation protein [Paenibacillus radicibacter]MCR8641237.1 YjcZ family sporulation protein [Paenibacillus radicibacter]
MSGVLGIGGFNNTGSILVLFILLVIISCTVCF